jgi:hypothetical protein
MASSSLAFGFGGKCLVVETSLPEVLAAMTHRMGRMAAQADWELVSRVRVERDAAGYRLEGDPAAVSLPEIIKRLECEVLDALVRSRSDLMWFHAGAAASQGRSILIVGLTGCGKSTLVLELCRRGWLFLTDDMAPIERESRQVHPLLRTPVQRVNPGINLPAGRIQELNRIPGDWAAIAVSPQSVPLGLLLFPVFDAEADLCFEMLSPAAAAMQLAQCCLSFIHDPGATLHFLSNMTTRIPAYRVRYSDGPAVAERVTMMWPRIPAD